MNDMLIVLKSLVALARKTDLDLGEALEVVFECLARDIEQMEVDSKFCLGIRRELLNEVENLQKKFSDFQDKYKELKEKYGKLLAHKQGEVSEEKNVASGADKWAVQLDSCGANIINCIKIVREYTGLSLMDAKSLCQDAPSFVLRTTDEQTARNMFNEFKHIQPAPGRERPTLALWKNDSIVEEQIGN